MPDDLKRLLDLAHSGEDLIEGLLRARGDAEIDTLIERAHRWGGELTALGEAVDPMRLSFHIVRPTLEETARIRPSYPELRDDQRGHCNFVETAVGRLNAYLRQTDAQPKGKGGNRRTFNDDAIVAKARAILKSSGTESKTAAAREAMRLHPKLFKGRGDPLNILKRIARQM